MNSSYRELIKHSGIYGIGQVLSRLTSFLLLPVYTRFLEPADYGCIAILDLTQGILALLISTGMGAAVTRHHFEATSDADRDTVWWTGLTFIGVASTLIVLPAWLGRSVLGQVLLGPEYSDGSLFFSMALTTLWFSTIHGLPDAYLRVQKRSGLVVSLALMRLLFNVAVNVTLLSYGWGVLGILTGNLLACCIVTITKVSILVFNLGAYRFDRHVVRKLWIFGAPLVLTSLLSLVMHQADRYFVRLNLDMHDVGIYSFAYTIGQGVNTILLGAFGAIWSVTMYDIAGNPNSRKLFARIFECYVYGLLLLMLGLSLFSKPLVALMASPDFQPAAELIPVIALAYLFFSMHSQFKVPVFVKKKTHLLVPASVAGVLVNVVGNYFLVPVWGAWAAAWVSVATFAVFSFTGLLIYRRYDRYPYRLARIARVLVLVVATYVLYDVAVGRGEVTTVSVTVAGAVWICWAAILAGLGVIRFYTARRDVNKNMVQDPSVTVEIQKI